MKHVLWAIVLPALVALAVLPHGISRNPYDYDESDYMYAARLGAFANHTDTPTLPLAAFLRIGLSRGRDSRARSGLSEQVRSAGDVVLYRHWHGPLYYYWLIALSRWKGDEHAMRVWMLMLHALTFLAIYFGCLWVLPGQAGLWTARLSSLIYLFDYTNLKAASSISPHALFVLCFVASLLAAAKTIETGKPRYWYGAVALAGMAFCTLEVALVLVAVLALVCLVERRSVFAGWDAKNWIRFAGRSAAVFIGVVLLTWSGAVVRLSFLKAYFFMAYLAVFRRAPWGDIGFIESWRLRFSSAPVQWILVAGSVFLWFALRRKEKFPRATYLFLLYGALMLLAVARVNSDSLRYMSPYFPAFELFAGFVLARLLLRFRAPLRYTALCAIALLLAGYVSLQYREHPARPNTQIIAMLGYVRDHGLASKRMLVPQRRLPVLHYYFPEARLQGYVDEVSAAEAAAGGQFDGILVLGREIWYNALGNP